MVRQSSWPRDYPVQVIEDGIRARRKWEILAVQDGSAAFAAADDVFDAEGLYVSLDL
jgi:hypothetical protein